GNKVLMDMITNDEIDVAICATPANHSQTVFEKLFVEEVVLLLPENHALAQKECVQLSDLKEEKLVVTNRQCPYRGIFEDTMVKKNCIHSYRMEVSNLLSLKYFVQAGFGPAIVPLISVAPPPVHTVMKRIVDFEDGITVDILTKTPFEYSPSFTSLLK